MPPYSRQHVAGNWLWLHDVASNIQPYTKQLVAVTVFCPLKMEDNMNVLGACGAIVAVVIYKAQKI